jgi:hypothetical protein
MPTKYFKKQKCVIVPQNGRINLSIDGHLATFDEIGFPEGDFEIIRKQYVANMSADSEEEYSKRMLAASKTLPKSLFDKYDVQIQTPAGTFQVHPFLKSL